MKLPAFLASLFGRPPSRVLCDPNLPPRWQPLGHTLLEQPPLATGEGEFPIRMTRRDWAPAERNVQVVEFLR